MAKRINRCIELLEQDQAIYYDGPHSGHVLTHTQGRIDAAGVLLTGDPGILAASATQPQTSDQALVPLHARPFEIIQQPTPLADHDEQASP